jgi:NhaP-type Na+/H+ or K+/H+ antiporter
MEEPILQGLVSIIVFGVSAQWLAMRLKLPSILFLLVFGFLAGSVFDIIRPDEIFGDLLFPFVSLCVAVILFEGGMDLKLGDLKEIGKIVRNLISVGMLSTWTMVSFAAYYLLNLNLSLSILIGAILVVTGPTVIGPLLRHVRPSGRVGDVVKWEGIMIDPIGVLLAVLVFQSILVGNFQEARILVIAGILKTVFLSSLLGIVSALVLTFLLKRYWIPEALHQVVTLMFIFGTFFIANSLQIESGLLSVTLMGVVMANQKKVDVKHILDFKENLRVLIISILFIILSARLELSDFQSLNWNHLAFIILLIVVIRPVSILLSSIGTDLNWKEKLFLSLMAPRGIVAAAMASIFSYELIKHNYPQATSLIPITFIVIIATVGFYGLIITPVSRLIGISKINPQGVLILGAHSWARAIAHKLKSLGFKVLLVDSNMNNVRLAQKEDLKAYNENVMQGNIDNKINLDDIGRLLCLTSNEEANALATVRFQDIFGMANVFQLSPESVLSEDVEERTPKHLRGRYLFKQGLDYNQLTKMFTEGATIKEVQLTEELGLPEIMNQNGQDIVPLFLVGADHEIFIYAVDDPPDSAPGQKIISLAK